MGLFLRVLSLSILFLTAGCGLLDSNEEMKTVTKQPTSTVDPQDKSSIDFSKEISITAIGDVLIHDRVYEAAETSEGYNFMPMMEQTESYLESSTITIANQETMIGGEELGLSGYPAFNSPVEIGNNLKELGVDVVTLANNHTLDKGTRGINNAIEHWEKIDMKYTGAYQSKEASEEILVHDTKEGIRVAILSYTYGTNGVKAPDGKSYVVNRIELDKMAQDIEKAKEQSDAVLLSLHFGDQYEPYPNQFQKDVVQFAADRGVTAVIGHHPHVLQPLEWVEGKDGHKMLTAYSLGNFFSGQESFEKRVGGILTFNLKMDNSDDNVEVVKPRFKVTYVTSAREHGYEVIPMDDFPSLKEEYEAKKKHLAQWMPELEFME
ncbi:homolog to PGA biosynthesis protein CapA [Halobacillus halophilus DSM 2266]|uniref:Homolog to PGA biosynthesis protein CapA n=1 Tax=Halobacillus halophilus (strain ATCC 35676 / DSM 2266 / JCM 20832 / KCTC 3685 / LMG 17431 / NBRC 102448 / NCIMB 2269) TaxID=866895 RepID=I0JT20_HALH3|nr:homolog to PGA biosynthesis protein CapA [Halobacillus halophilus DSM 2266]